MSDAAQRARGHGRQLRQRGEHLRRSHVTGVNDAIRPSERGQSLGSGSSGVSEMTPMIMTRLGTSPTFGRPRRSRSPAPDGGVNRGPSSGPSVTEALGREVAFQAVPPSVYRAFGFPGADDLGNMFQYKAEFETAYSGARTWRSRARSTPSCRPSRPGWRSTKRRFRSPEARPPVGGWPRRAESDSEAVTSYRSR
jgi:hypothetical protein